MLKGIKETYNKIKVMVVEAVIWAETEFGGRTGEEKKAAVVDKLDTMIVLPFYLEWLDNLLIGYLVDLACEKMNWLTDWLFGKQDGTTEVGPEQVKKVAAILDVPIAELAVSSRSIKSLATAQATSDEIDARLDAWYEQYGVKPDKPEEAGKIEIVPEQPQAGEQRAGNFSDLGAALSFTLRWEGGYVNHPDDPGGETNMGITKAALNHACANGIVPHNDVKNLTREQAGAIYRTNYWDKVGCGKMTDPIGRIVFDMHVNHGQAGMARIVQRACNALGTADKKLAVDGKFGAQTKTALFSLMESRTAQLAEQLLLFRKKLYDDIVKNKPSQRVFLKGWYNRLNGLAQITVGHTLA